MNAVKTMTRRQAHVTYDKEWVVMELEPGPWDDLNRTGVVVFHGKNRKKAEGLVESACSSGNQQLVMFYGGPLLPDGINLLDAIQALYDGKVEPDPRVLERWL